MTCKEECLRIMRDAKSTRAQRLAAYKRMSELDMIQRRNKLIEELERY